MKRPLTGLVVAYASGIWLGSLVRWPVEMMLLVVGVLLCGFLLLYRTRPSLPVLFLAVFALGAFAYRATTTISSPRDIVLVVGSEDQNVSLRGLIVSDTGSGEKQKSFRLHLQEIKRTDEWVPVEGTVYIRVSEAREPMPLRYGDVIECSALLRVPPPVTNPGTFDWRAWLARQNIHFTASVRKTDECKVLASGKGNPVVALSLRWRERFERTLHYGLEDEPVLASVLAGMIIGERSEIPPDTYADFQRTGVFHIFSISGLNVGMVTAVVLLALRLAQIPRRWCVLIALPLVVVFVFATGGRPGAMRALVMAGVWMMGWLLVRPCDMLNSLAAAALVILVWEPAQLFDGGFVLSFMVVLALVLLTPRFEQKLASLIARDPLRPRQLAPRWQIFIERPAQWTIRLVCGSVAAWVGLLPLMAGYFHLFTPVSVPANILVVPVVGGITALGMLAMLTHPVWPWLALTLNNANFFMLSVMMRGIEWLSDVPGGHWFVQAPPVWITWMYYVLGLLLLTWKRWRMVLAVSTPLAAAMVLWSYWPRQSVELTVLDLKDGASAFLDLPGERHDWLLDGGADWSGERIVVPFLRAAGCDRLEAIVLTCNDKAHAAGLRVVLDELPVGRAVYSGLTGRSKYFKQWLDRVRERQILLRTLRAGDEITLGDGAQLNVLHPPPGAKFSGRSDNNSLVLMLERGSTRVLLMSDAGETVEKHLLESGKDLRAQVIVKGRHGEESSCTDAFLDAVRPEAVVQIAGVRPSKRYPQPDQRDRLAVRQIALYVTDQTGAVTLRLDSTGYSIRTCLSAR